MTGKAGQALNTERIRVCLHLHPFSLTFGEYFAARYAITELLQLTARNVQRGETFFHISL